MNTTTATYDLAAIMQDAWARVRKSNVAKFGLRFILRNALRAAWSEAKHQRAMARLEAQAASESPEVRRIKTAIAEVEGKNRWTQQDYARRGVLRAALRAAEEHEEAAPDYAEKRALIEAAKGRFCAVTFTKADGTERTMKIQPATLKRHVKGDAATDAGKKAVATRKARHPHLLPVWDAEAKAPRSVNLATVMRIAVDGQIYEYAS